MLVDKRLACSVIADSSAVFLHCGINFGGDNSTCLRLGFGDGCHRRVSTMSDGTCNGEIAG